MARPPRKVVNQLRRERYRENLEAERESSRTRQRQYAKSRTPEEHKEYLARHRLAQAKYRASCRKLLVNKQQEYRKAKKHDEDLQRDRRELEAFEAEERRLRQEEESRRRQQRIQELEGQQRKLYTVPNPDLDQPELPIASDDEE